MSWYGKLLGALAGALLFRGAPLIGVMIGLAIGHAVDAGWFKRREENPYGLWAWKQTPPKPRSTWPIAA